MRRPRCGTAVLGAFAVTADEARDLRHGKRLVGAAARLERAPAPPRSTRPGALVGVVERRGDDVKSVMNLPEEAPAMILWFTIVQVAVAVAAGLLCVVLGLAGRRPSDLSVGGLALLELLLIVQIVIAIIAPLAGNPPTGSLLEFWVYLVSAALIPPAAVAWALLERSRWSTVIMGIGALAVAVMVWRMQVIWTIQVA